MSTAEIRQGPYNRLAFRGLTFALEQVGMHALMRNGELVEVIADWDDAESRGRRMFKDGLFTVEPISATSVVDDQLFGRLRAARLGSGGWGEHAKRNRAAFAAMTFPEDQTGRFALVRNGRLEGVFQNERAAVERGLEMYGDGLFSEFEIGPVPMHIPHYVKH